MRQYLDLLQHVLDHGAKKEDRTGHGHSQRIWRAITL